MNKLAQIVSATRSRLEQSGREKDRVLERQANLHQPRGFRRALRKAGGRGAAVIAELKKASPSKGLIRAEFHAAELAAELAAAGAAGLSVLTNEEYFQGSLENLAAASAATPLPCLRKDFIVDRRQIVEARAYGADAVLLIVAALSEAELRELSASARELEIDVLCEVHDAEELQRALEAQCDLIGVNSRDLRTFQVDLNTALSLGPEIPEGVVRVAESGIESRADIARLRGAGYHAFLIGETLMRAERPGMALQQLLREPERGKQGEAN
jgi:indole-3-glycerol phosphate synthase